jgi:hypothetical protein
MRSSHEHAFVVPGEQQRVRRRTAQRRTERLGEQPIG